MSSTCSICKSKVFEDDEDCRICSDVDSLITKLIDDKLNLSVLACRRNEQDLKTIDRLKSDFTALVHYRLQGFTEYIWTWIDKALQNFAERAEDYQITNVTEELQRLKDKYPEAEKSAYTYYHNKVYEKYSLETIPKRFIDDNMLYAMWLGKIDRGCYPLYTVPKHYLSEDICWAYVSKGNSLGEVPYEYRTKDICCKAVKRSGISQVQHCPVEFRPILYTCLAKQFKVIYLEDVPEEYRTPRFYYWMLFNRCAGIYDVPKDLWSIELWSVYVEKNNILAKTIPKEFQTRYNMLMCMSRRYENNDFLELVALA